MELLEQNLTQSEMDRKYLSEQNSAITKQLQAKWDAEIYEMKERDNELATLNDEVNRLTAEKVQKCLLFFHETFLKFISYNSSIYVK